MPEASDNPLKSFVKRTDPQLSEELRIGILTIALQSPEMVFSVTSAIQVTEGEIVSNTETIILHVAKFPEISVTVKITSVSPTG